MDEIRKIPPVTRTLVGGVLAVTLPCLLQLLSPYKVIYVQALVFKKFQLWRLVTSFLYGGSGLPLLFDTFMLFRGLNDLEESHFQRRTADFVWALIIIAGGVMGTNYPLRTMVFFRPFLLAVTHLWAQTNAQNRVSLFGIINLPAPYFPFALILLDLVQAGPSLAIQSATGVVAAHAYYFLAVIYRRQNGGAGLPFMGTPIFLVQQFGNGPETPGAAGATYQAGGGWGFRPPGGNRLGATPRPRGDGVQATGSPATARAGTSAAEGVRHRWGSGHRLGEQ